MARHIDTGNNGEKLAVEMLVEKGYNIHHTNWRNEKSEVDIIAEHNNVIVFAEVKTRSTDYFGDPAEAVQKKKQKMLVKAAEAYIELNNCDQEIRYDIISIVINKGETKIEHIEDAFYPFASELD